MQMDKRTKSIPAGNMFSKKKLQKMTQDDGTVRIDSESSGSPHASTYNIRQNSFTVAKPT